MLTREQARTAPVTTGRHEFLAGDGTTAGFDVDTLATALAQQGASTTRRFRIPTQGSRKVVVTVKPTITGAPTARIISPLADGTTENTAKAATALTLTNNTITEASRTLDGEDYVIVEFITAAAQTITLVNAEYRCEPA